MKSCIICCLQFSAKIILHHFAVSSLRILGHWISGIYEELENMTHILQTRKCQ